MYYDYFLTHRALQIQHLCAAEREPRVELPSRLARSVASKPVADLCRVIESICRLPMGAEPQRKTGGWRGVYSRLLGTRPAPEAEAASEPPPVFTAEGRDLVNRLETDLVRVRIGDDSAAAEVAAGIMQALWQDQAFFNGLKPLAIHTEHFAYEFLFPTWFNLYTVLAGPSRTEPGYSLAQIKTLFRFLEAHEQRGESRDPELVGMLTFLANRLPLGEAAPVLQRLVDLCCCPASDLALGAAGPFRPLRDAAPTVGGLLPLVKHYLIIESSLWSELLEPQYPLVPGGLHYVPAPEVIGRVLQDQAAFLGQNDEYTTLIHRAGRLFEGAEGLDESLERLVKENEKSVSDLLGLMVPPEENRPPLSPAGQSLVTQLLLKERDTTGQLDVARVRAFARFLAPRMDRLDDSTRSLWDADFVESAANRKVVLECAGDAGRRTQIAARLLQTAKRTAEAVRLLDLAELAAILDPAFDDDRLRRLKLSTKVLRLAIANGSIVQSQLSDLVGDLQDHLPESLTYLESPAAIAGSKSDRLAKLYLTLESERNAYAATGRIGNFAIIHAAHGKPRRRPGPAAPDVPS